MIPRRTRICVVCKKKFEVVNLKHYCCSRKCFIKKYRQKIKKNNSQFPTYRCEYCHRLSQLNFSPNDNEEKLEKFICPFCGKKKEKNLSLE